MERTMFPTIGKKVSRLCFGALTISPLQRDFDVPKGASLMAFAYRNGINFFDTADLYGNYPQIRAFLESGIDREDVVLSTKSYAYDRETAKRGLDRALESMRTEYVDFFLLHEQESEHTLRGHREAYEYFLEMKQAGLIRAVGLSTHHIAALKAAVTWPDVDVVHPIVNRDGIGLVDGTMDEAEIQLRALKARGVFMYGMKPLGGGHLIGNYQEAMAFALGRDYLDAVAVGMQSEDEVLANVLTADRRTVPEEIQARIGRRERKLLIHDWCIGCGRCIDQCQHSALRLEEGKALVEQSRCVFCGYCATVCPEMCIKVI